MRVSNQPSWSKGMDRAEMKCISVMYKQEHDLDYGDKIDHIPSDELKDKYAAMRNATK